MEKKFDVICVDDSSVVLKQLGLLLKNMDVTFDCIASGTEGLKKIVKHKPRLAILDLIMPDINGDDIIIKLSEEMIFENTMVCLYTSCELTDQKTQELMTLGFYKILKKPVSSSELAQLIKDSESY